MDYLMKQYILHFLLRIYDLTLFFIYHYVLNSPSKIMQFRYRTSQTAYSTFYYNLKMSFKEEFFFILSLIICPSPPTYEICESLSLLLHLQKSQMVILEKKVLTKCDYWIRDPLNNISKKLKIILQRSFHVFSLLYLMKQNVVHSPTFLIFSKAPYQFCQP